MPLPAKAFDMLVVLVENRGRLIGKDELFNRVWPDQIVEESNLTCQISAIRKALGERRESSLHCHCPGTAIASLETRDNSTRKRR